MPPSKVCPQCNAVVPIRLKICRNRLKFALYNADRVNFKSRNYHVVAYNISILAEGLHFSALVIMALMKVYFTFVEQEVDGGETLFMVAEYASTEQLNACGMTTLRRQMKLKKLVTPSIPAATLPSASCKLRPVEIKNLPPEHKSW